jgi:RimJ/RimL family protein N-acetyltransferase
VIPLPIETARLRIRAWTDEDLPAATAIFADPEVMRYVTIGEWTVPSLLDHYRRTYAERGYGFWALCERGGRVVGDVGFHVYEPTGEPELGYTLARDAWGRGYATEAGRACVDALFAHTSHRRVVALVDTRNAPSLHVAEKIGFIRVDVVDQDDHPHHLLELTR